MTPSWWRRSGVMICATRASSSSCSTASTTSRRSWPTSARPPERRAGVLVDHLVAGSKESRIAQRVSEMPGGENVLVLGHPYVDVWQAVKPARVGLERWPDIPRGTDIKHGTLEALGWPHADQADIARGWQRILATVRSYKDLEPSLRAAWRSSSTRHRPGHTLSPSRPWGEKGAQRGRVQRRAG